MIKNLLYSINIIFIPLLFVLSIWIIKAFELIFLLELDFGVVSKDINSIYKILIFPLIHNDIAHLINNTYPILILGGIISIIYKEISNKIFLFSYLLSGIILWIIGDVNVKVIGASGCVYALASFIIISGFIKKQAQLVMMSFLVIFLYGSIFWGMLPMPNKVSWEGHLAGFIAGIILAIVFRHKGPKEKKYSWEIEEELLENKEQNNIYYEYKEND